MRKWKTPGMITEKCEKGGKRWLAGWQFRSACVIIRAGGFLLFLAAPPNETPLNADCILGEFPAEIPAERNGTGTGKYGWKPNEMASNADEDFIAWMQGE